MEINLEAMKSAIAEIVSSDPPEVPFLVFVNDEDYQTLIGHERVTAHNVCGIECLKYRDTFVMVGEKIPKGHYRPLYSPKLHQYQFVFRDDDEVRASQVKGYTYILP